jgi:hypothetical protein
VKNKRDLKNGLAILFFALSISSFFAFACTYSLLVHYGATIPAPDAGLRYPLPTKGHDVYVTASQITGLSVLWATVFLGFFAFILIVPKRSIPPVPIGSPPPLVGGAYQTDLAVPQSDTQKWLFILSIACASLLIYFLIEPLGDYLVARGIIFRIF